MSSGFSFARKARVVAGICWLVALLPAPAFAEEDKKELQHSSAGFRLGVFEGGPIAFLQWNTQGQFIADSESGFICLAPRYGFSNSLGLSLRISASLLRESTSSLFFHLGGEVGPYLELFEFGAGGSSGMGLEATGGVQWWASSSPVIALSFSGRLFFQIHRKTPGIDRVYVGAGYTVLTKLTTISIQAGLGFALF